MTDITSVLAMLFNTSVAILGLVISAASLKNSIKLGKQWLVFDIILLLNFGIMLFLYILLMSGVQLTILTMRLVNSFVLSCLLLGRLAMYCRMDYDLRIKESGKEKKI